jgi:membrane associated rhomboid family serine protease
MAGRFSYSTPERGHGTPWFKIGDIDVTTTVLVAATCVLSLFVWAIDSSLLEPFVLFADDVRRGQLWRLVTWPLVNTPESIWTILTIAIFWYFGRELEGLMGRNRFATFLVILTVFPAVIATIADFDLYQSGGLSYLELGVFLTFIVEYPQVRFFFGIPGWVIGAVIVGIQLLQLLGLREIDSVLFLIVIILTAAFTARSYGLATQLPWIPKIPLPGSGPQGSSRSGARRSSSKPKRAKRRGAPPAPTVIDGPWQGTSTPKNDGTAAAQAELDALLDKISAGGLESLSNDEKRRLNELSKRLR